MSRSFAGAQRRRIQQRDIAALAGVSVSTVSRVLNNVSGISEELQQRVIAAATELGYSGPVLGVQTRLQHVGLFTRLPLSPSIDPFHAGIISGIEMECRNQGIHLSYAALEDETLNSGFVFEKIRQNRIDCALFMSIDDRPLIEAVLAAGVLAVLINAEHPGLPIDTFLPDNYTGALLAMQHLIANGHRRILHMSNTRRRTVRRRYEAYMAALQEAGIPYDPTLAVEFPMNAEEAYEQARLFLATHPVDFTAVFCANDLAAMGMMRALEEAGYAIPDDISMVGYDDISTAAFLSPPLTTIRIEREELGALAVRRLIERAANPEMTAIRVELACRLIIRRSVAIIAQGVGVKG